MGVELGEAGEPETRRPAWVFAHDHRFVRCGTEVFSHSQFEKDLWPRYLAHCRELTVIARSGGEVDSPSDLRRSSHTGVAFVLLPDISNPLARALAQTRLARLMRPHIISADGVIARLPSTLGLIALAEARRLGKPTAVEVAGCAWDGLWHYGSLAGKLYAPRYFTAMRRAIHQADCALYVTRDFLQRRYPTQAEMVASASNVELPAPDEAILRRRLARIEEGGSRPLRFGTIATLRGRFKGIQIALQALAGAHDRLGPFSYHVLGPGDPAPWRRMAAELGLADRVHFSGTLPPGRPVLEWLDKVDVYLQPSLKEGLPRGLIEAMSRGCPAIAADTAGIPELLPEGWLTAPGDAGALQLLVATMASDREAQQAAARANFNCAREFERHLLEDKRSAFWGCFARQCEDART